MTSYKSRAEATDDRACLGLMREALNAAHNAVRLDECRLWTIRGSRGYVSTWGDTATAGPDGQTWALTVGSKTPRHWTFAKQRMASFPGLAHLTQDGDEEGVFRDAPADPRGGRRDKARSRDQAVPLLDLCWRAFHPRQNGGYGHFHAFWQAAGTRPRTSC